METALYLKPSDIQWNAKQSDWGINSFRKNLRKKTISTND